MKTAVTGDRVSYLPVSINTDEQEKKSSEKTQSDEWLGTVSRPTRRIGNSPFFLSRLGEAKEPAEHGLRVNERGYDRDDPQHAIACYEASHKESTFTKMRNAFSDAVFNLATLCVPKLLSVSAGKEKQRIDPKIVLRIVRESVDIFPELKIRISKEAFNVMDRKDQLRFHKKMAIIRQAQHEYIANELSKAYPGHINVDAPTILYTGGRATGCLRVLYCSVDEYIALYWSDWGLMSTDSGSYKAHVYDYITEGQNINWNAHHLEFNAKNFEITEPGEYTFLGKGDRKIWSFEGPCGMVDHGIGDVISMAKYALVSNFTSTLNFKAAGDLLSNQAKAVAHEYGQRLKESLGYDSVAVASASKITEKQVEKAREYFAPILARADGK